MTDRNQQEQSSERVVRRIIQPENHPAAYFQTPLDEGYVIVEIPANLSQENVDDAIAWFELIIRRLRRGMPDNKTKDAAAAEYVEVPTSTVVP